MELYAGDLVDQKLKNKKIISYINILNMVKITHTNNVYRITLEKNKNVNIRDIYNSIFFLNFQIKGVRIYSKDSELTIEEEKTDKFPSLYDNKAIDDNEDNDDGILNFFGKERKPSGYSDLPLFKSNKEDNNIVKDEDKDEHEDEDEEKIGMYDFLNDYISKYTSNNKSKNINENEIILTIPFDVENPIISLTDISIPDKNDYFTLSDKGITYNILENIVQDLYLQIIYLREKGYYFNEIPIESTFLINNRYIVLSIETISIIEKNEDINISNAFVKFLSKLLDIDDELKQLLEKIQYTELYYFIKRVRDEHVFLLLK